MRSDNGNDVGREFPLFTQNLSSLAMCESEEAFFHLVQRNALLASCMEALSILFGAGKISDQDTQIVHQARQVSLLGISITDQSRHFSADERAPQGMAPEGYCIKSPLARWNDAIEAA